MRYKIVFSIPIHERLEVVLDQVINFFHFNHDCAIVFHLSQGFNYRDSKVSKDEFLRAITEIGNVYVNPESVRTGGADIIQTHLSNFRYINSILDFVYFSLCASNELFIKEGLYEHIVPYDCGLEFLNILSPEQKEWVPGLQAQKDIELKKYIEKNEGDSIFGSHVEGSFYKKELFAKIANEIESFYDYHKMPYAYPREEIYFSSVVYLIDKKQPLNILKNGLFSWSRWKSLMNLKVWEWDIKRLQKKSEVYSLKRVDRDINANLRMYMRKCLDYADIVHKYVPEATEKGYFSTFCSDSVDFSIECCRMIYRRIRRVYWRHSGYYQNV